MEKCWHLDARAIDSGAVLRTSSHPLVCSVPLEKKIFIPPLK